ncbi:MAG: hypothetical protein VXZ24_00835 [Pseudomonadota bacterium]|nr:hypothetical protein [Pseudomonadota bacterium]
MQHSRDPDTIDQPAKIAIFAARRIHRHYANKLISYLKHAGAKDVSILWYKNLWHSQKWIVYLLTISRAPLLQAAMDYVRTKQSSPASIGTGGKRFYLLLPLKWLEAKVLYSIYFYNLKIRKISHLVIWNGLKFRQRIAVAAARDLGIPSLFIERGLFPGTTTLDPQGINYLNSVPRDKNFYAASTSNFEPASCTEERPDALPKSYIFVPFQVNTDSQIVLFSPWLKNMFELVQRFSEAEDSLGDNMPHIVFKPHPECDQDYSALINKVNGSGGHLHIETDIPTPVLIGHSDAVCTINSSVGMEAILMNKKLITLGKAFYDIPDLTLHATNQTELEKALSTVDSWQPDEGLRNSFLAHIRDEHIVPGSWQNPDDHHLDSMATRILSFVR